MAARLNPIIVVAGALAVCLGVPGLLPGAQAENGVVITAPVKLFIGGKASVTVSSMDLADRSPADLRITLTLQDQGGELVATLFEGQIGPKGSVNVPFKVPDVDPGSYRIVAEAEGIPEPLAAELTLAAAPGVFIQTDKPIYKPSQTIQGRIILVNNALTPVSGDVEVSIMDAKGIRIDRRTLTTNEFGVAPFDLLLADEVNFGTWRIHATAGDSRSQMDVRVEPYVLPRFSLDLELERNWFTVDEPIPGTIRSDYFFGKPVQGTAEIVAERYIGVWEEYERLTVDVVDGVAEFVLPPVEYVSGTDGAGGDGSVTLEITVTDGTGHSENTTEVLRIAQGPAKLQLIAGTPAMKPGIPFDLNVVTETPGGTPLSLPVDIHVEYFDEEGREIMTVDIGVETVDGLAEIALTPPEKVARATITGTARAEKEATARLDVRAAYSPTSSFIAIRPLEEGPYTVGNQAQFSVIATHSGTTYYEVVCAGRTVLSDAVESREIAFTVTPEMAPSARLVAYTINPDCEVSADTLPFDVGIPTSVRLTAEFSSESAAPGDTVELTFQAPGRAMIGLALVDESVFALAKSKLGLQQVFDELERRFMDPLIEVHFDGGEPEDPFERPFWGGGPDMGTSVGAEDALRSAGLQIVASDGLTVPAGKDIVPPWDWWWRGWEEGGWEFLDDGNVVGPAAPGAQGDGFAEVTRVRQFFPETWVWNPTLLTDENGTATLELTVPDSITNWKLHAVSTSEDGLGVTEADFTAFQDFFAEPDLPIEVTRGEEFPLRIQLYNYIDTPQEIEVAVEGDPWFELIGYDKMRTLLYPNSVGVVEIPIRPIVVGEHEVRITARGPSRADAVIRTIRVVAEGVRQESVLNSVIAVGEKVEMNVDLPPGIVPDSGSVWVYITPSLIAQTINGIDELLNMPCGCGEQNMIYFAPDVEILRYLRAVGEITPEVRAKAEQYINTGYQRELTYQRDDGSFAAFGNQSEGGSQWLTAFVLSSFASARDVKEIDESVLDRAAAWLVGKQTADGSWDPDSFLIHTEMSGGLSGTFSLTAFVAIALVDYDRADAQALSKAKGYLEGHLTDVWSDSYSLAIASLALLRLPDGGAAGESALQRLLQLAIVGEVGIHWEPYPIETTSYAALALMEVTHPSASGAVEWLATQRNSLGGFGHSTQDTVLAIRALVRSAIDGQESLDGVVRILDGETELHSFVVNSTNYDVLQGVEVPAGGTLDIAMEGEKGSVSYQVVKRYNVPGEDVPPGRDMILEVIYDAEHVEVDDIVDVHVRVMYTGFKKETSMAIVDVGVPTGFAPVRESLDALVEAEVVSRADVAGRKIILYIDKLVLDQELAFVLHVLARFPVRAAAPNHRAYEYYDPEVQAADTGEPLTIQAHGSTVRFVRGDLDASGSIQLVDVVKLLSVLFSREAQLSCVKLADVDDSGKVNLVDAIRLLLFVFANGQMPAAPYPECDVDPTPDTIPCAGEDLCP